MDIISLGHDGKPSLFLKPDDVISVQVDEDLGNNRINYLMLVKNNPIYLRYLIRSYKYFDNEVPEYPVTIDFVEESDNPEYDFIMVYGSQSISELV